MTTTTRNRFPASARVMCHRLLSMLAIWCCAGPAAAIVGVPADSNGVDSPWAGVGSISIGNGVFTGTLIAPDLVLTSAHVVAGTPAASITFNLNFGGELTHRIAASDVIVNPAYHGFKGFQYGGQTDLAIIRLRTPAPAGVPIYGIYSDELPQGAVLNLVGYGASGTGEAGITRGASAVARHAGQNVADCFAFTVGADNCGIPALVGSGPRAIYLFDFDRPDGSKGLVGGTSLGPEEVTLATGDSGSPAFVQVNGQWRIAAVNTFVINATANGRAGVHGTAGGGVLLSGENGEWVRQHVGPVSALHPEIVATTVSPLPEFQGGRLIGAGLLALALAVTGRRAWAQIVTMLRNRP